MNLELHLERARQGGIYARGELIRATYYQLRALAAAHMRDERPDHSLTASGAYLRFGKTRIFPASCGTTAF
jgi:hypothetical protein